MGSRFIRLKALINRLSGFESSAGRFVQLTVICDFPVTPNFARLSGLSHAIIYPAMTQNVVKRDITQISNSNPMCPLYTTLRMEWTRLLHFRKNMQPCQHIKRWYYHVWRTSKIWDKDLIEISLVLSPHLTIFSYILMETLDQGLRHRQPCTNLDLISAGLNRGTYIYMLIPCQLEFAGIEGWTPNLCIRGQRCITECNDDSICSDHLCISSGQNVKSKITTAMSKTISGKNLAQMHN